MNFDGGEHLSKLETARKFFKGQTVIEEPQYLGKSSAVRTLNLKL